MRVLVVGGAGYIGSHAVRELAKEGNDVVVLDALYTGHRKAVDPKAKFYQGDIENTFLVSKILRDEKNRRCNALCCLFISPRIR